MVDVALIADRRRSIMMAAAERWCEQTPVRSAAAGAIATAGPGAADTIARQSRFAAREGAFAKAAELRAVGRLPLFIERKIGTTLDFLSSAPNDAARRAGRPVARIVTTVDPNRVADGFATGFLVTPTLLMTNWHVFPDAGSARGTGANFLHEFDGQGVEIGVTFAVRPERFSVADERLDFAVVAIDPMPVAGTGVASSSELGFIGLSGATSKILVGQGIDLVEYPDGGAKQFVTQNNRLLGILDAGFLQYESDTLEGSSGSPAFSEQWELVGVHHAGIPEVRDGKIIDIQGNVWTDGMPDDQIHWVANEGVRISAIVSALAAVKIADPAQNAILRDLLAGTADPADEITRLITTELTDGGASGAVTMAISEGASAMGVTMNFTGPVTINVYGSSSAGPATAPAEAAVAVEKSLRFDPDYDDREGYKPDFLGAGLRRSSRLNAPRHLAPYQPCSLPFTNPIASRRTVATTGSWRTYPTTVPHHATNDPARSLPGLIFAIQRRHDPFEDRSRFFPQLPQHVDGLDIADHQIVAIIDDRFRVGAAFAMGWIAIEAPEID